MVDKTLHISLVLFIFNICPCLVTSDVFTSQTCPKNISTENQKFFQLCGKFRNQAYLEECGKLNYYLARLESLQKIIFKNNQTADEFWVAPDSLKLPCPQDQTANKYLSYNGLTVNTNNRDDSEHYLLCEQDEPLSKQPVPKELSDEFKTVVCSSLSCYVQLDKKIGKSSSDECCKKKLNSVQLKSWAELEFIRKELDSLFNNECTNAKSTGVGNNKESLICESSILSSSEHQFTIVKSSEKDIVSTSSTSSTDSPKTNTTVTNPVVNSSTMAPNVTNQFSTKSTLTTDSISSTNLQKTTPLPGTNRITSKFFECPNGKMWKTNNLNERGERGFDSTVRSKLECMVISQQQKCPYAFYEKSTSTCQTFYQKTSNSAATKQLDCINDYCYTCIERP